jgi:hypothetical protein
MRCGRVYPAVEALSKEWTLDGRVAAGVMHLLRVGALCDLREELKVFRNTRWFGQGMTRVLNSRWLWQVNKRRANEVPGSRNQVSVGGLGSVGVVGLRLGC